MTKQKEKKVKSVLIYTFYGQKQDKLVLTQKKYNKTGFVWSIPNVEVKEDETVIDAAVGFMKLCSLNFIPMENQDEVNIPCFVNPKESDNCVCTVYGSVDNHLSDLDSGLFIVDKEEALRILEEENVDIVTYYLLLMFIAGCMK